MYITVALKKSKSDVMQHTQYSYAITQLIARIIDGILDDDY